MRKAIKIILVIAIVILVKLVFSFKVNKIIIKNYKNNKYNYKLVKSLYFINYPESYIAYYNHGNILYRKEQYDEAVEKFKKAIEKKPPEKRICDVRVNLSLAMVKSIREDMKDDDIVNTLVKARDNLYENECAHPNDDNGKSKDAEKLEEEINKLLQQQQQQQQQNDPDDNQDDQNNNQDDQDDEYQDIEDQIRENQRNAQSARQDEENRISNYGNYEYHRGKKW